MNDSHVSLDSVWTKLIDYYYDHVHFEQPEMGSIQQWVNKEYGGQVSMHSRKIYFSNQNKRNWFVLKWL